LSGKREENWGDRRLRKSPKASPPESEEREGKRGVKNHSICKDRRGIPDFAD